jgi:hypothetical protein
MDNYANEIIEDIRSEFGDSAISKFDRDVAKEISESIAIFNAMTDVERDAILYLQQYNYAELQALYKRVKEREGM